MSSEPPKSETKSYTSRRQDGGHIVGRHIEGTKGLDKPITSLFPTGEVVKGRQLPYKMTKTDVENSVFEAIKNSEGIKKGSRVEYTYDPQIEGIDEILVSVEEGGDIVTAYPGGGSAVHSWLGPPTNDWLDKVFSEEFLDIILDLNPEASEDHKVQEIEELLENAKQLYREYREG